jgi:excisionase family DNA binding protein
MLKRAAQSRTERSTPKQNPSPPVPRVCLSRREAAQSLGASEEFVDALIRTGSLKAIHRGRRILIATAELQAWAQRASARRMP